MALEIEAKMQVLDHAPIRQRLELAGARRLHRQLETNTFLDTLDHQLQSRDSGLRVRRARDIDTGLVTAVITHKGPRQPGVMKTRPETEVKVASYENAVTLLEELGYQVTLSFEKRRESWKLDECEVELDELPQLGRFVEIEGPGEAAIERVRGRLELGGQQLIQTGYATMVAGRLAATVPERRTLTFADCPTV
jgi:adenylate cyclase, class 2